MLIQLLFRANSNNHFSGHTYVSIFNTLRPRQDGRHFPNDIFEYIFLNENVLISLMISLKFVPKVWINNIPALIQIMAWRRSGDKPLFEPMMVSLLTHICVTRPQWVKLAWPVLDLTWIPFMFIFQNGFQLFLLTYSCTYCYHIKLKSISFVHHLRFQRRTMLNIPNCS